MLDARDTSYETFLLLNDHLLLRKWTFSSRTFSYCISLFGTFFSQMGKARALCGNGGLQSSDSWLSCCKEFLTAVFYFCISNQCVNISFYNSSYDWKSASSLELSLLLLLLLILGHHRAEIQWTADWIRIDARVCCEHNNIVCALLNESGAQSHWRVGERGNTRVAQRLQKLDHLVLEI